MIRPLLIAAGLCALIAAPASAYQTQQIRAPNDPGNRFTHGYGRVSAMTAGTVAAPPNRPAAAARGTTVVYDVSGGKQAARVDVSDARDNPFMAQPSGR